MNTYIKLLSILTIAVILSRCNNGNDANGTILQKVSDQKEKRKSVKASLMNAKFKLLELNILSGDSLSSGHDLKIPADIQTICSVDEATCGEPIIPIASISKIGYVDSYDLFEVKIPGTADITKMGEVFKNQINQYLQTAILPDTLIKGTKGYAGKLSAQKIFDVNDPLFFFSNLANAPDSITIKSKKYKVYRDAEQVKKQIFKLACGASAVSKTTLYYNLDFAALKINSMASAIDSVKAIDNAASTNGTVGSTSTKMEKSKKKIKDPVVRPDGKPQRIEDSWVIAQLGECKNGFREVTRRNLATGETKTRQERYAECDDVSPEWVNKNIDDVKKGQVKQKEL